MRLFVIAGLVRLLTENSWLEWWKATVRPHVKPMFGRPAARCAPVQGGL